MTILFKTLLFSAHFFMFAFFFFKRKAVYYLFLCVLFFLLLVSAHLHHWVPHWQIAGYPAYQVVRIGAYACTAVSLSFFSRRIFRLIRRTLKERSDSAGS